MARRLARNLFIALTTLLVVAGCAGRAAKITSPPSTPITEAENVTPLFMSANLERVEHGGKVSAVRISEIVKGSRWDQLGFQDGDEITAIGGKPVNEPDDFFRLLEAMARPQSTLVELYRRPEDGAHGHPESLRVRASE